MLLGGLNETVSQSDLIGGSTYQFWHVQILGKCFGRPPNCGPLFAHLQKSSRIPGTGRFRAVDSAIIFVVLRGRVAVLDYPIAFHIAPKNRAMFAFHNCLVLGKLALFFSVYLETFWLSLYSEVRRDNWTFSSPLLKITPGQIVQAVQTTLDSVTIIPQGQAKWITSTLIDLIGAGISHNGREEEHVGSSLPLMRRQTRGTGYEEVDVSCGMRSKSRGGRWRNPDEAIFHSKQSCSSVSFFATLLGWIRLPFEV